MENDVINEFLKNYNSQNTINSYRRNLDNFFKYIKVKPEKYIKNGRNYQDDIKSYWNDVVHKLPPLSRNTALTSIRMFLEEYLDDEIYSKQLSNKFFKRLKRRAKGNKAITKDLSLIHI